MLLAEINHRVANSLALVSALMNLQSKAVGDNASKDALAETQDRILAVSLVHRRLYSSPDVRSVALDEYVAGLLDHLRTSLRSQVHGVRLSYEVASIKLETDACLSQGIRSRNGASKAHPRVVCVKFCTCAAGKASLGRSLHFASGSIVVVHRGIERRRRIHSHGADQSRFVELQSDAS
ncbi:histidine kinase dimerization/phosphoacceptor domain -containing protein [Mesorhizobium australicum]|uniref:histidine kinase dimerization/phosphoacceptor domain -containing protein n=1 Tax=Mesorhizobium australicum TaxID=536018 RepID=UPI00333780A9